MKKKYAFILGHNPILSIAEVLSIFDYKPNIVACDRDFLIIEADEFPSFFPDDFGGIIKFAEIYDSSSREDLLPRAVDVVKNFCKEQVIEDKLIYAVSVYGKEKKVQKELLLEIKKESAFFISGKRRFLNKRIDKNPAEAFLNSEGIYDKGVDLICCEKNGIFYLGVGLWSQNIDSYAYRDMRRPHRDSRNGMLPPKLAQSMLNLAREEKYYEPVWDPFCGSGTVLMESLLQRRSIIGSDYSDVMVGHSEANVGWMITQSQYERASDVPYTVQMEDVTSIRHIPVLNGQLPKVIVTEGYLGKNFRGLHPTREETNEEQKKIMEIWKAFFEFLNLQKAEIEIVAAFPIHILSDGKFLRCREIFSLAQKNSFYVMPLVSNTAGIDKTLRGSYTQEGTIMYVRGEQFVGREIIKFKRK
ncbi:MAG: TRM11 family SAM-dependent methyltransferase [Candidatus Gracilibacteria bacterium]